MYTENSGTSGYIFIVSAPSAAGKTTLVHRVLQRCSNSRLSRVITYTTRPARYDEQHGVDYYFVDTATFWHYYQTGAFIEYSCAYGACYASAWESIMHIPPETGRIMVIDRAGAARVMQACDHVVSIWIMPPGEAVLYQRLCQRGLDSQDITHRMQQNRYEMDSECCEPMYHHWIVNDDIQDAEDCFINCISRYVDIGRV